MIPEELKQLDVRRVQWLCAVSQEAARRFCSDAHVSDPSEVHCARFALRIATGASLPAGYAWQVHQLPEYSGKDAYVAPIQSHVRLMAFAAADMDTCPIDPLQLLVADDRFLRRVAIARLSRSPAVLSDDRIRELSRSDSKDVRSSVAAVLKYRPIPDRVQILKRLIEDPSRNVAMRACFAAVRIKEPELLDLMASKEYWGLLSFSGDPRGRPCVEKQASSENPLDWEEGIAKAIFLGDPDILRKARQHPDWESRAHAITGSAHRRLLSGRELDGILCTEGAERAADLLLRWPKDCAERIPRIAQFLHDHVEGFPTPHALMTGQCQAIQKASTWSRERPVLTAAITRIVPRDSGVQLARGLLNAPESASRLAGIEATVREELTDCFPHIAELCLDRDETVRRRAASAVARVPIACGIHGLDTMILKAGDEFSVSSWQRMSVERMLQRLIAKGRTDAEDRH